MVAQTGFDIKHKRQFLRYLGNCRNVTMHHYTDKIDSIESRILPLVRAFDSKLTTPIYSCEGHWDKKTSPYVSFVVLPDMEYTFFCWLSEILESTPEDHVFYKIVHRHRPRRYKHGPGPFIEWYIMIDVPFPSIKNSQEFVSFLDMIIPKYSKFFADRFANFHIF